MDSTSPHPVKHGIVRSLSDPGAPVLDSDAEVQQLVLPDSGESDDSTTSGNHEAVDLGCGDFLLPALGDDLAGKWVGVLREHLSETNDCACLLSIENARNIRIFHRAQKYRRSEVRHPGSLRAINDGCPPIGRTAHNAATSGRICGIIRL